MIWPFIKALEWYPVAPDSMPDADILVLLAIEQDGERMVSMGYWTGEAWIAESSGAPVRGAVLYFSYPAWLEPRR